MAEEKEKKELKHSAWEFVKPEVKAPEAPKAVEGKPVKLVALHYKRENTHLLNHVHAIVKGVNHVPVEVWEAAKAHPANASMLKSGDIEVIEAMSSKPEAPAEEAAVDEAVADEKPKSKKK